MTCDPTDNADGVVKRKKNEKKKLKKIIILAFNYTKTFSALNKR